MLCEDFWQAGDARAVRCYPRDPIADAKANGATMADVVQVIVYVTDIRVLDEIRDARLKHWPKGGPSSAIVEVTGLAFPELMVEISAVAVLPS